MGSSTYRQLKQSQCKDGMGLTCLNLIHFRMIAKIISESLNASEFILLSTGFDRWYDFCQQSVPPGFRDRRI